MVGRTYSLCFLYTVPYGGMDRTPKSQSHWFDPSSYPQPPNFCMEAVIDHAMRTWILALWIKQLYNQWATFLPAFGRSKPIGDLPSSVWKEHLGSSQCWRIATQRGNHAWTLNGYPRFTYIINHGLRTNFWRPWVRRWVWPCQGMILDLPPIPL